MALPLRCVGRCHSHRSRRAGICGRLWEMKHSREVGEEGSEVGLASLDPWVRRWSQGHPTIGGRLRLRRELPPVKVAVAPGSCPQGRHRGGASERARWLPCSRRDLQSLFKSLSGATLPAHLSAWPKAQVREALFSRGRPCFHPPKPVEGFCWPRGKLHS